MFSKTSSGIEYTLVSVVPVAINLSESPEMTLNSTEEMLFIVKSVVPFSEIILQSLTLVVLL